MSLQVGLKIRMCRDQSTWLELSQRFLKSRKAIFWWRNNSKVCTESASYIHLVLSWHHVRLFYVDHKACIEQDVGRVIQGLGQSYALRCLCNKVVDIWGDVYPSQVKDLHDWR